MSTNWSGEEREGRDDQGSRPVRSRALRLTGGRRRPLAIAEILTWADEYRRLTGRWPQCESEPKGLPLGQTWSSIQSALTKGLRGLPGGSTLSQVLAENRGFRGPLTVERILAWADAHHSSTGRWPTRSSGRVLGTDTETWVTIDMTLVTGRRSLPGGSSLARLLAATRPVRNLHTMPRMTIDLILTWADAHRARTGRWPRHRSGPILEAPGETWNMVNTALYQGLRGLPGRGRTLAQFLTEHRGAPSFQTNRPLTIEKVLAWADAHHAATGRWPVEDSGPVIDAPDETWSGITMALQNGNRELPSGLSLARLLAKRRGTRNPRGLPRLTLEQIQGWAETYRAAHGRWPSAASGPIPEAPAPGETWMAINTALDKGLRGLPGGQSVAQFLSHLP